MNSLLPIAASILLLALGAMLEHFFNLAVFWLIAAGSLAVVSILLFIIVGFVATVTDRPADYM